MKIHYGSEFKNTACRMDPTQEVNSGTRHWNKPQWVYTQNWKHVNCKRCLRAAPSSAAPQDGRKDR